MTQTGVGTCCRTYWEGQVAFGIVREACRYTGLRGDWLHGDPCEVWSAVRRRGAAR